MPTTDRKAPARAMASLIASLDGSDYYGIPPLTAYQRFNSVGGDMHGQCAVAQGARGYRIVVGAGLKVGVMVPKICPISIGASAGASLDVGGARIPTSLVVLFRLPRDVSAHPSRGRLPLALAQLDGVTWTGSATLSAEATAGASLLAVVAAASVKAGAKTKVTITTTRLTAEATQHFADASRAELAQAVDDLLVLEAKRAAITILNANGTWFRQNREGIAIGTGHAAATGLKMAYATVNEEQKKLATDFAKTNARVAAEGAAANWEYVLAGTFAVAGAAVAAVASDAPAKYLGKAMDVFLGNTSKNLIDGLRDLLRVINAHEGLLLGKPQQLSKKDQTELDGVREARQRLVGFIELIYRPDKKTNEARQRFAVHSGATMPGTKVVGQQRIGKAKGTSLTLTSWDWELSATASANAALIVRGKSTNTITAPLIGRDTSFRFELNGSGDNALLQDTKTSLMHMNVETARKLQLMHTGVDDIDRRLMGKFAKSNTDIHDVKVRCFGALTYRSASVYVNRKTGVVVNGMGAITLGVSVRVAELCAYADEINRSGGHGPLSNHSSAFEKWVERHIGCTPPALRSFVTDSDLGSAYTDGTSEGSHARGFPADALLLDVAYVSTKAPKQLHPAVEDDLFKYYVFTDQAAWVKRPDVSPVAMRLRYRIQSPLSKTSKITPRLGLSPFNINLQFGIETEVGQESIVDLHTQFADQLESKEGLDQFTKNELTPPPVALFNRG